MNSASTYTRLIEHLQRMDSLSSSLDVLEWDQQVNLPPASTDLRTRQMSVMSEIVHREATRPEIGEWLSTLENDCNNLTADQQVVVRECRKDYDRLVKIPPEYTARLSAARSRGFHAWKDAREKDDFSLFAPFLQENLNLAKEEAAFLGFTENAYDYWLDRFDPGLDTATVEKLFTPLRQRLVPLVQKITNAPVKPDTSIFKAFPAADQDRFLRRVVSAFGFDFQRGRLDVAVHPFCGGHPLDTRMTTRFSEDNPLDSLSSAMHEAGHALYEQGLPPQHVGTPLGESVGMAVHESQSRLWENQIGRSRAFWNYWEPAYRETFPSQLANVSSEALFLAINAVRISPIRVDADEVTYNLHIMIRFEMEKRLFSGECPVAETPAQWNTLSSEILSYLPRNNAEGCLQDVHWSEAFFGYFPSYCLGNLLAAQLWHTLRNEIPDIDERIEKAEFAPILEWLRSRIHQQGRRYGTRELTRRVTGHELRIDDLLTYLESRYLPIYNERH